MACCVGGGCWGVVCCEVVRARWWWCVGVRSVVEGGGDSGGKAMGLRKNRI